MALARNRRILLIALLCNGVLLAGVALGLRGLDRWVSATVLPPLSLPMSRVVEDRDGHLLRAYMVDDGIWRLPVSADQVDPRYIAMLLAYEDRRFYRHHGVDPRAMLRAAWQAVWNRRVVSGASTLTMQVARLLEDSGTGRLRGKLRQIRVALALERRLTKKQILALYLQLAPFGGNIEGVRAASLAWFGKEPRRLTAAQAALLVALPQAPESRRPDRNAQAAQAARNRVLMRVARAGALPRDEARAALQEILPDRRRPFPMIAPHVADRVTAAAPARARLRLTIRRDLQQSLESLAAEHVRRAGSGLSAAVIVMDHGTGEVLASVGSAGYTDAARLGFIDMTRAVRSPGSTLKPLIYGLAFDDGIAHPETLFDDRPMAFGNYAPQNFDKRFHGVVSLRDALRFSYNLPAVALLDAVGPARLMARMRRAGVNARLPGVAPPGRASALGGVGMTLRDRVALYGAIARGGRAVAPHVGLADATPLAKPVMSRESAWQVASILSQVPRPVTAPRNDLAYKTGTSYGYRDAWAIGFDGRHVIGVWMGRPDGASVPGLSGAEMAAPLLFEAFGRLKPRLDRLPPPPDSVLTVTNSRLPPPLRRFKGPRQLFAADMDAPEFAFPPDGARVDLGLGGEDAMPLVVRLRNGTPPFTWIADGVPVIVGGQERQVQITPPGRGFVSISVIDAKGRSARRVVELR
ncbi:MAG: penicillin-binding protein 1C [Paracoccaceae bacterium]|nr:penicillin-binding protein 1C [Paracoccaceae bacterium]